MSMTFGYARTRWQRAAMSGPCSAFEMVNKVAAGRIAHPHETGLVEVMGSDTGDGIGDDQDAVVAFWHRRRWRGNSWGSYSPR